MKKRFFKLFTVTLTICSLIGGGVASAGTLSSYGNHASGKYAYSYTGATGSWASTSMYSQNFAQDFSYSWTARFGYAYGESGYAQTPTTFAGLFAFPSYSTHSCDSYTTRQSF